MPPKDEAGFAGYYLQTRVLRILAIFVLPVLFLCVFVVVFAVAAPFLHAPLGLTLGVLVAMIILDRAWPRFESLVDAKVYPWFIGRNAEGHVRDALVDGLSDAFYLLNDVVLPNHGGNIDHIVVGPSGVHAIETKGIIGDVNATGDRLIVRGYSQDKYIRTVKSRRDALRTYLEDALPGDSRTYPVFPVIVFTRASEVKSRGTTSGVCIEDPDGLIRLLDKYADRRRLDELHRAQIFRALRPRVASAGKRFVPTLTAVVRRLGKGNRSGC